MHLFDVSKVGILVIERVEWIEQFVATPCDRSAWSVSAWSIWEPWIVRGHAKNVNVQNGFLGLSCMCVACFDFGG